MHGDIVEVPGAITPGEAEGFIARAEALGFAAAPVSTDAGPVMDAGTRSNARVMVDDARAAATLWDRVRGHVPAHVEGRAARGLNERLRFYRYDPGERFAVHRDGFFRRPDGERSFLTLLVYLNEGFEGGETTFLDGMRAIRPMTGAAVLFPHALWHEGSAVRRGRKYVLRSDVMYAAR